MTVTQKLLFAVPRYVDNKNVGKNKNCVIGAKLRYRTKPFNPTLPDNVANTVNKQVTI